MGTRVRIQRAPTLLPMGQAREFQLACDPLFPRGFCLFLGLWKALTASLFGDLISLLQHRVSCSSISLARHSSAARAIHLSSLSGGAWVPDRV